MSIRNRAALVFALTLLSSTARSDGISNPISSGGWFQDGVVNASAAAPAPGGNAPTYYFLGF